MYSAQNNRKLKTLANKSSSPNLHLPRISANHHRHLRSSPSPSSVSMASANTSENVSALKAKYSDYSTWLKASSRQNREPIFTQELLKQSLCQMGIDSNQAEQLVSTCSWYVYQFQKELETDSIQNEPLITKSLKTSKRRHERNRTSNSKKSNSTREHSADSSTTVTSVNKENCFVPGPPLSSRSKFTVLPAIQPTDRSISPRSRRVDFDNEQQPIEKSNKSSHLKSSMHKVRVLPKLRPSEIGSSTNNPDEITPDSPPTNDLESTSSQKISHRNSFNTRSILRKHSNTSSLSMASNDLIHRRLRNSLLSPSSTIIDEIPLGTKSQRLFGGSECFAQIINELEEQKLE